MIRSLFQLSAIAWLTVINIRKGNGFKVYWNVPSKECHRNWTEKQQPKNYGILVNNGNEFVGDKIVTLYETNFGLYPHYKNFSDPSSAKNGGIPQRANMTAHLDVVQKNITSRIPDDNFNGLIIIDYEMWRPLFAHNWYTKRIYQQQSVDYIKARYRRNTNKVKLPDNKLKAEAEKEFNEASLKFLTETIAEVKKLRPKAHVGFYGMPFCNYSAGKDGTVGCGETFKNFNDQLQPLYGNSTALFPSIYLPSRKSGVTGCLYVTSVLQEAERIAAKTEPPTPLYAYAGMEYFPFNISDPFYTEPDLSNELGTAFNTSIDGVIIWSTSREMKNRCAGIGNYVKNNLGPKVQTMIQIAEVCKNSSMPYDLEYRECAKKYKLKSVAECQGTIITTTTSQK